MPKYQATEIVDAVQWFPGVEHEGLRELTEAEKSMAPRHAPASQMVTFPCVMWRGQNGFDRYVYPGNWLVTRGNGFRQVWPDGRFNEHFAPSP